MEYTLTMVFTTTKGGKQNFSLSGVKEDISKKEVNDLMDAILNSGIFTGKYHDLAGKSKAYVTAREVTKHEVA